MSFKVEITKTSSNFEAVTKAFSALENLDLLVGIPQEKSSRKGKGPNNAELAYIHSNGSPKMSIPARPFLEPAIEANKEAIAKQQAKIIQDALAGKTDMMLIDVKKLGLFTQNAIKAWFTDPRNNWPPNSPATAMRKIAKKYKSKKRRAQALEEWFQSVQVEGMDPTVRPLIDTSQLRNAITYVIRQK